MSREWKRGDVAMADGCRMMRTQSGWLYASPGSLVNYTHAEGSSADHVTALARPLVVIDAEDAEQVERLCKVLVEAMHAAGDRFSAANGVHPATVIAALREFADPKPRIEEPTGLGAVVEAIYDNRFVHIGGGRWQRVGDSLDPGCEWAEIDVVAVLSEGVTS